MKIIQATVESPEDKVEAEVCETPHRETPSVFKATKMFFHIHLVSYFVDEDTVTFLRRCHAVLIQQKTNKLPSALKSPASVSEQSQRSSGTAGERVVENQRECLCDVRLSILDVIWPQHLNTRGPPDHLPLAALWRSSVCHGPLLAAAALIPHMMDECCPLRLCVSYSCVLASLCESCFSWRPDISHFHIGIGWFVQGAVWLAARLPSFAHMELATTTTSVNVV